MASLLFDYAAIEAATKTLEPAKDLLRMAVEYGYPSDRVQPLLELYDQRIARGKTKQYAKYSLYAAGACCVLFFLYRRGIFVISSNHLRHPR